MVSDGASGPLETSRRMTGGDEVGADGMSAGWPFSHDEPATGRAEAAEAWHKVFVVP
jgi:hypothetical protein